MRNHQTPSIYSIYHNALPFYLDRADICQVEEETPGFSTVFVDELLDGKLSRQVNVGPLSAEKLRHLYFEARNHEKVFGAKTFGFGFPLLIDTFNSDLLVAPMFIWQLQLEPAQSRVDSWVLKLPELRHVQPNHLMFEHLREKYGYELLDRAEELAFSKKITHEKLNEFAHEVAATLNLPVHGAIDQPIPAPGIDEIGSYARSGALHWSGVLGLYPPQYNRWQPGNARPENVFVPKTDDEPSAFVFAYQPDDPEQATAQEVIARQHMTVLQGEDALGRAQTLANLLINSLSNGKRCLVVSERAQSLKFVQSQLSKAGLLQLNFLLDDALNDKTSFLELLRTMATSEGREVAFKPSDFEAKKTKFLRAKAAFQATYAAVKTPIFGEKDWTEMVGMFLASSRVEGKERLASHLNAPDFSYQPQEHDQLIASILRSEPLFAKVKTLTHPLNSLNDKIFDNSQAAESQSFVEKKLGEFMAKTNKLQAEYIRQTEGYAARLREHYREYYLNLDGIAKSLLEKVQNYTALIGPDFASAGNSAFEWPILFSTKKKKIKQGQEDVAKGWKQFLKASQTDPYFEVGFEPSKDGMNIPKTVENIGMFRAALGQWFGQVETLIQEEVLRLNSKTAHPSLDVKEVITTLEYSLDSLLSELNETGLYQKPFENKTLTIPQRQKYLESVIEQLENTRLNLRDFGDYHAWQSNWLGLGALGQKVIRALVKVKPNDWVAAFESWYYASLLSRSQSPSLPESGSSIEQYMVTWGAIKPLIFNQIQHLWQERQSIELKALKKSNKAAFSAIFEKAGQRATEERLLYSILSGGMNAVTAYLPVLFATPHVVLNELPTEEGYFDLVIFDEANKFSVETATAIAPKGKKIVISGSNDANGNESSLLQYALENGVTSVTVTNQYEPHAPLATIAEDEIGLPYERAAFFVENVEGRFHEVDGTNDVEAQTVVRLLNQIKQTPQRVFPSVGIVTFTVEQRDLIANYLLKLKQQNALGSERIQQLERNGMGIFQLDELYGQQFEVLIVSCTYGAVNLNGELSKKLQFLNTTAGVGHLKMLVNKPAAVFHVVHSIPEDKLQLMEGKKWEEGTWLLAHFIRLAEAVKNGNKPQLMISMEALGKRLGAAREESTFINELTRALGGYIDSKRLTTKLGGGGVHFPLAIKPLKLGGKTIVLHPDGLFATTKFTSAVWEHQQQLSLESSGFWYLPVWSVNWFKAPEVEARLLASKVIKLDAAENGKELDDIAIDNSVLN